MKKSLFTVCVALCAWPALAGASGPVCDTGLQAFTAEMHPFLRNRCASCHDVEGPGPAHSVADPAKAYAAFRPMVNFLDLDRSKVMSAVRERHWLEYDSSEKGATPEEMKERLTAWYQAGEYLCPSQAVFATGELDIPANLPKFDPAQPEAYVPLRWSLAALGPDFKDAYFEVEIQKFSDTAATVPGSYRVRKPRIVTPVTPIHVKGVRFAINKDVSPLENGFTYIDQVVQARSVLKADASYPFPVLSAQKVVLVQRAAMGEKISVQFDVIEPATARSCTDLAKLQSQVLPVMESAQCFSCHGGGSANAPGTDPARLAFPMAGGAGALCASTLERIDLKIPEMSPLILYPMEKVNAHPDVSMDTVAAKKPWLDWIRSEGKAVTR